ncbi:hypothetical protein [Anabaena sp. AL93]|uniref:hypothetical protein n=1 Tax=Anabaena sp. AL93 TaxID=1678133 RepID=UPI0025BC30CA|nr:hypothetical protein [Anabaena sp. AL93]
MRSLGHVLRSLQSAMRSLSLPQTSPPKFLEEKFGDVCIAKRSLYPKHHPRNS